MVLLSKSNSAGGGIVCVVSELQSAGLGGGVSSYDGLMSSERRRFKYEQDRRLSELVDVLRSLELLGVSLILLSLEILRLRVLCEIDIIYCDSKQILKESS